MRSENHESKVKNSFIVWRPMSLPEDRSWETGKSDVAKVCIMNGVKGAGVIIWRALNSFCYGNLMRQVLLSFLRQL